VLQARVAAHDQRGIHLAEAIPIGVREPEHARRVLDRLLTLDRAVRDDLRDPVLPVFPLHVTDHVTAPALVEVDVDVGHRDAFGVEEALEHQVVAERVELGDAERVGHDRPGRATASGAHSDPLVLGPVDEIGHDEEVTGEPHVLDHT
jgi:hypothetical protein